MSQVVSNVMMEIFNPPSSADVRAAADSVLAVRVFSHPLQPLLHLQIITFTCKRAGAVNAAYEQWLRSLQCS